MLVHVTLLHTFFIASKFIRTKPMSLRSVFALVPTDIGDWVSDLISFFFSPHSFISSHASLLANLWSCQAHFFTFAHPWKFLLSHTHTTHFLPLCSEDTLIVRPSLTNHCIKYYPLPQPCASICSIILSLGSSYNYQPKRHLHD